MNTDKLKEGQKFKNYKELCEFLGEKVKSSNSKTKQLKEWQRYFEFEKNGIAYKIIKVYNKPQAITYMDKLELLLLNMMVQSENNNYTIFTPKTTLLENLNIINDNYRYYHQYNNTLAERTNIDKEVIYDFFRTIGGSVTKQLERALKNLSNSFLVKYTKVNMVCVYEYKEGNKELIYRRATKEEVEYSLMVKNKVMKEMDCKNEKEIIIRGIYNIFIKKINEILKEESDYRFFYMSYEIIFNKENVNMQLNDLLNKYKLDKQEYEELVDETNSEHVLNIIDNAQNRQYKALQKKNKYKIHDFTLEDMQYLWSNDEIAKFLSVSRYNLEMCLLRSDENYVNNIKKLAYILIDKDTKHSLEDYKDN